MSSQLRPCTSLAFVQSALSMITASGWCRIEGFSNDRVREAKFHNGHNEVAMVDANLYALYKLHLVDQALSEYQARAHSLDTGKAETEAYRAVEKEIAPKRESLEKLEKELQQLSDTLAQNKAKRDQFDKKLYDGSVTNAREVDHLQKEIEMLGNLISTEQADLDARKPALLPLKDAVANAEAELDRLRKIIAKKRKLAQDEYAQIQTVFAKKKAERDAIAKQVSPEFARPYDSVRQKTGNTGMATITVKQSCSQCGMHVAEKTVEMVKAGRINHCEQCRRILFLVVGDL